TREDRFTQSEPLRERGMASGVQVRVGRREAPWGVLGAHTPELRSFSADEVDFLQSVANVLAAAIDRWETEERTRHRALHDALTGLPNRTLFLDRLTHALDRAGRDGSMVAVLFLDIDNFKIVNDSLGHESGDALLRSFAPRLQGALRPSDTVARFGGDEFVVLCEDLETADGAVNIVERVLEGFSQPLHVAGRELFATASIGVALARGQRSADGLLRDADAAMYRAKARGRARYELFDEEMRERVSDRLRTEIALRRAVIDGGLEVHYQPLVSLEDGAIVGAEALLRWHDEERGWVPPVEFIPVAEDSGLIVPMGTWVLEQACREALAWAPGADGGPLEIAVNLSSRQVAQPEFGAEVERVVAETGIDPARLTFEITESVVMEEAEAPMESIRRIEDLGVKLALDDFGTGYSSLSYLDRLPIDILKLDRSFIAALAGMRGSPTSAIVAGVVTMAKALGLVVVAEGVEEPDQVQELRRLGCAFAQGFLFSPAVPAAEFRTLLGTAFDVDEPAATGT
ncbi:MAG: hypothetical protein QOE08_1656, partial [Thermoleophilaceae bacterium]|nr:hypothetical protein [Thermoleophilaceae bacterium]